MKLTLFSFSFFSPKPVTLITIEVEEMPSSETRLESSSHEKEEEENDDNVLVQRASFIESTDSMSEMPLHFGSLTSNLTVEKLAGHRIERGGRNCINNDNNNESSYSPKHEGKVEPEQGMMIFEGEEEIENGSEGCRKRKKRKDKNLDLKDESKRNGFASYLNHSPVNHSSIPGQSRTKIFQWCRKKRGESNRSMCHLSSFLSSTDVTEEEEETDSIRGYLNRSDTAVIFPEPVNNKDNGNIGSCNKGTGGPRFNPMEDGITVSGIGESQWSWWWWLRSKKGEWKLFLLSLLKSDAFLSRKLTHVRKTRSGGCTFLWFKPFFFPLLLFIFWHQLLLLLLFLFLPVLLLLPDVDAFSVTVSNAGHENERMMTSWLLIMSRSHTVCHTPLNPSIHFSPSPVSFSLYPSWFRDLWESGHDH